MSDLSWQVSLILTLGGFLILGGLCAFVAGLIHDEKSRKRILRGPHAQAERTCYRMPKP